MPALVHIAEVTPVVGCDPFGDAVDFGLGIHVFDPGAGGEERRRLQWEITVGSKAIGEAAPRPVFSAAHQRASQRVPLDIAARAHEGVGPLQRHGEVAPLIDGPLSHRLVIPVPPDCVGSRYPVHEADELVSSRRLEHEMPVIGHDAVGEQLHRISGEPFLQDCDERAIIRAARENRHAPDAAIDNVDVRCEQVTALLSSHVASGD